MTAMKGRNTIVLNKATMIEAAQLWVDDNFQEGKRPTVKDVKQVKGLHDDHVFEIEVMDMPEGGPG